MVRFEKSASRPPLGGFLNLMYRSVFDNLAETSAAFCTIVAIGTIVALVVWFVLQSTKQRRERRRLDDLMRRQSEQRGSAPPPAVPQQWDQGRAVPTPVSRGVVKAAWAPRAPSVVPSLDLATFAPLSEEQVRAAAQGANLLSTAFTFGLRSQIPPVSDPRTLLIDKAMVAQGLITPEELAEIHRVGEEMDQLRPRQVNIAAAGQRAVQQALEEKQRLKEQKKAAAAQRERERAAAVARRRASDIIFLGRGVSKGLADRRSDIEKLSAAGLPVLATPADVAAALGVEIPRLRWLAFHSDASAVSHYVRFTVPKRSGGTRQLFAPREELGAAQEWILQNVLEKVAIHPSAHGFVKGHNTLSNASPHVDRDVVVNADLENFFPTITFARVLGIFKQLGYSPAVATVLALLCTESPRRLVTFAGKIFHVASGPRALPQGACTSPALSNLASRRLDARLNGIAMKLGWTYTRYADDMTFSTSGEAAGKIGYLLARLRHIAQDEGFAVNEKKTRVLKRAARQEVTGVVVNKRPGVPRDLYKRLRAILHRAKHEGLAKQNRENRANFEAWLGGMIAYIQGINAKQGMALRRAMDQLSS